MKIGFMYVKSSIPGKTRIWHCLADIHHQISILCASEAGLPPIM